VIWLEWAIFGDAQVASLVVAQFGQLDVQVLQVRGGNLFVELLWQNVNTNRVLTMLGPQLDLSQHLVGERVAHDEAGVTVSAAQVDQATLGEHDQVTAVGELVAVHLGLDVHLLDGVLIQPLDVELEIEVTDVAQDCVVGHVLEVTRGDDVLAAGGGDKDAALSGGLLHRGNLEALHGGLQGVDRIDLGDDDTRAERAERVRATLAHISVAGDHGHLAGQHDVGGTLDTVDQGLSATVQVVELGLKTINDTQINVALF
jgi:hypothetical protein